MPTRLHLEYFLDLSNATIDGGIVIPGNEEIKGLVHPGAGLHG